MHYLGIEVDGPMYMFSDNQSVVTSSTLPHSSLTKCHNALSYHRIHEATAARVLTFFHMDGKKNPSDILSKLLASHSETWKLVKPLLFWHGEVPMIRLLRACYMKSSVSIYLIYTYTNLSLCLKQRGVTEIIWDPSGHSSVCINHCVCSCFCIPA